MATLPSEEIWSLFKEAGASCALDNFSDMEKAAIFGRALGWLAGKAAPAAGAAAHVAPAATGAVAGAAPGLLSKAWGGAGRLWGATGGRALKSVSEPLGNAANRAVGWAGNKAGLGQNTIAGIQRLGAGAAGDAVSFGALSGGINAAMADPGERMSAFGKGFAGGALGGAAWRMGGNVATGALNKGLGAISKTAPETMKALQAQPWFRGDMPIAQRAKGWGAKALMGGAPLVAGYYASEAMPTFGHNTSAQTAVAAGQSALQPSPSYYPSRATFNPNLPF